MTVGSRRENSTGIDRHCLGRVLLRALWRRSRQGDRQIDESEDDPEVPEGSPNESLSGKGVSGASGETRTLKVLPP